MCKFAHGTWRACVSIIRRADRIFKGVGSLCQYTLVEPELIVGKPPNITHEQAASFPLAGLTAYLALVRNGGLKQGDGKRVFINGGSGGVGAWGIQVCK
jgi:NADPH:quinone reductase-like Zn-dependent oxidoreductase